MPTGNDPCWDNTARRFRFEPGATITIGVDNDLLGEALVAKWNADFPALRGRLVYRNYGSVNGESTGIQGVEVGQSEAPDVVLIVSNEAVGREVNLLPLHPYFENLIASDSLPAVNAVINRRAPILVTAFWDGMSFSWNETMLRQLGVNVDRDSNGDALPDAIDSWEKIFELGLVNQTYKGNRILEVFPLSLDEPWSGYSSVSSTGFVIFQQGADRPGFETPQFLGGLEFIQAFSRAGINLDETGSKKAASAMGWCWDQYLNDEAYPFGLVGTWMNLQAAQQLRGATFRFSAMPIWQGNPLRPFGSTQALVVEPKLQGEFCNRCYGVLIYTVDSSIPSGEGPVQIYPKLGSTDPYFYDGLLNVGDELHVAGFLIRVIEGFDESFIVNITKSN